MAEVSPVHLCLLARQGAQPQVGLGRRARAHGGDEVAEVLTAADVATLADHHVQPRGGERGELGQGLQDEGPEHIDAAGPQWRGRHWRAVQCEHTPHGVAVHMQLAGDSAHAPLLGGVQAQDLRDQLRGYGHGAALRKSPASGAGHGAGIPGVPKSPAALSNECSAAASWALWRPAAASRRRRPGSMRRCRVSMRPVEQPRPRPVNPDASHYLRYPCTKDGGCASVACVPRVPCGQGESAGSAGRHLAVQRLGPGASRRSCSSADHGRSGCTAGPGRGNARTGTGGLDGPCTPRTNRGAGRTRPSAPHCCGTAFIGTV
jgi:hypothetical protein